MKKNKVGIQMNTLEITCTIGVIVNSCGKSTVLT